MASAAFAACAALTLCSLGVQARSPAAGPPRRRPAPHAGRLLPAASSDLYSARAKRRIADYLRLRLLEMHREGLDQVAAVVEGRLPLQTLLEEAGVSRPACP